MNTEEYSDIVDDDDAEPTELNVFVICYKNIKEAPEAPFILEARLCQSNSWQTEYGSIPKSACSTRTFLSKDAAEAQLSSARKILSEV